MILEEQIKIIFISFIYGILFYSGYKKLKQLKIKKRVIRYVLEFIFCMLNSFFFFFFITYKINGGILSYYMIIFVIIGILFCHLLYFDDKKHF